MEAQLDINMAIKIAELWKSGKMIGGDEDEIFDVLLVEAKRQ
jgi:hypothetical protein